MGNIGQPLWHQQRHHGLDALRVFVFGLLILYHIGMAYVADWEWHIKSVHQSGFLQNVMLWSNQWRMSLLFVISGAAVAFMLKKQTGRQFFVGQHRRVLLPLLFGIGVVVAPQVYVELQQHGLTPGMSYGEFWFRYLFGGWLLSEALPPVYGRIQPTFLTWNHLWFLAYIFCYSVVACGFHLLVPVRALGGVIFGWFEKYPRCFLLVMPVLWLWLSGQLLWERFPPSYALFDDWFNHARYGLAFLWGLAYVRSSRFQHLLSMQRKTLLAAALITYGLTLFFFHGGGLPYFSGLLAGMIEGFIWSLNAWLWLITMLAWAEPFFTRKHRALTELNKGVYCFYILHQTLIVIVLYRIQPLQLGALWEPLVVLVATGGLCFFGYLLIREVPYLRVLLGIYHR